MSRLNCSFDEELLTYYLNFESVNKKFQSFFKLNLPDGFDYNPVQVYDGFVMSVIFSAMEEGEDFYIDLPISSLFGRNINYFIEAWHNLMPDTYKKINVYCNNILDISFHKTGKAIAAFSGGVDACFTLVRQCEKDWKNNSFDLAAVHTVQGFDMPWDDDASFNELYQRVEPIINQYSISKFKVITNHKIISNQDWDMSHAAQLACCLHLFSQHFNFGLIGSSEPYSDFYVPWGSTPCTDFLLSGGAMQAIHDGAGFSRTEKVERIAKNELATKLVKVCYQKGFSDNCGDCEKCYRTRLNFLAVGKENPECFNTPLSLLALQSIKFKGAGKFKQLKSILSYTNKHNIDEPWVGVLKYTIIKNHILHHSLLKRILRNFKYKYLKK